MKGLLKVSVFILCLYQVGLCDTYIQETTYRRSTAENMNSFMYGSANLQQSSTTIQVRSRMSCAKTCKVFTNCNCFKIGQKVNNKQECILSSRQMVVGSDVGDTDEYCIRCPDGYHLQLGTRCYKYSGHDVILTHDQANQVC